MKLILVLALGLSLCLSPAAANGFRTAATTKQKKVLQASRDNTIIESASGELSSGKGKTVFVGRTMQPEHSIRRGLIAFDIAGVIPAGSKITSVQLTLHAGKGAGANRAGANGVGGGAGMAGTGRSSRITLHRLLSDWGEGQSSSEGGRGAQSLAGDATWLHSFYPDKLWAQPGGDFTADESASRLAAAVGVCVLGSTPRMVADVQAWLDSPQENYGWLLRGDETKGATALVFESRESDEQSAQPQLAITYIAPMRKKK